MLETKVESFLNRHSFILENKEVVVGVSGGPDSLALLNFLRTQKEKKSLSIVAAHVDHMFRGEESYQDALFVKAYCEQYEIPFEMVRVDVPALMEKMGKSSQTAAREARYEFFAKVMDKYHYSCLALAHHGDDQIETMLMRLTRGSSGRARAGIPFTRPFHHGMIIRPFLSLTKAEIEEYCKDHGLKPRRDPSNEKDVYLRNRFRKEVLPFLKSENRLVHEHFQRFSEELQMDEGFLEELTVQEMNKVMTSRNKNKVVMDIPLFLKMPMPLQRRGIQLILNYLYNEKPGSLSALHIDQVFRLAGSGQPSGSLDFPGGLKIIRSYLQLAFQFDQSKAEGYCFEIQGPGMVQLPFGGKVEVSFYNKEEADANGCCALFPLDKVRFPLTVRTRKTGDRITLKGMAGSKKIKDVFIDCKVPREKREIWPVITDADGMILWLPELKKSSIEGMDKDTDKYLQITYHK